MFPELFKAGPITIYSYGFCILVGVILAYIFMLKNGKRYGIPADDISGIFLWAIVAVFVGGKLFFFFEDPKGYMADPGSFFTDIGRGFVFYGSFLVAVPVLYWRFRKMGLPVWEMFDLIGIAGALVHGFGKIGCFFAGCCYGRVCNTGLGVEFHNHASSAKPLDTPLYPTQLWDAGIIFLAVAIMFYMKNRRAFAGQLFLTYGLVYAVGRFITERYRGDEARGFIFDGSPQISHSQFIAVIVFTICLLLGIMRYRNSRNIVKGGSV